MLYGGFMGGDLAQSWGDGKNLHRPNFFEWTFFHFNAQNFWWPFFSHRSFSCVCCLTAWHHLIYNMYHSFLDDKRLFHITQISVCSVRRPTFARFQWYYFSKYWGDGCMGRPPPQILGGPSSQSPYVSAHGRHAVTVLTITNPAYSLEFFRGWPLPSDIVLVNNLVSLTQLLWVLRKFIIFTLHTLHSEG